MHRLVGVFTVLAALFVALGTAAGDDNTAKGKGKGKGKFGNPEQVFKKLDTNTDGKLSKEEFLKLADKVKDTDKAQKFKDRLEKVWTKVSVDNAITLEQFQKFQEMKGKRKKKTASSD